MAAKTPQILTFLLVGKTGVGKSSTGNSILGQEIFEEDSGLSVTKTCRGISGKRFNENIFVIDTPGACDTDGENTLMIIDNYVTGNKCELHVICLVLSSANRPTKEEMSAITSMCSLFGPEMRAYLIVVVTREEDLRRQKKTAKDFLLAYTGAGAELLLDCAKDDRVVGLDNFHEEWREKQVQTLLQKTKKIVSKNKGALYTAALFLERKKKIEKQQKEIRRKAQELKEERERLERKKRNAEIEEANRKVRLEEQEKAARKREEEIKALQQKHEERRIQEEETYRRRKLFKEMHMKLTEIMEADKKKQWGKKMVQREREFKAKEEELKRKAEEELKRKRENVNALREALESEREEIERPRQQEEKPRILRENLQTWLHSLEEEEVDSLPRHLFPSASPGYGLTFGPFLVGGRGAPARSSLYLGNLSEESTMDFYFAARLEI